MPMHPDFIKIHNRFVKQYGKEKGEDFYHAYMMKKGYDDTKPFPKKEKKEFLCAVRGVEIKETEKDFHVTGLIATSHIDNLDLQEGIEIPDKIPKATLESMANQINSKFESRIMGVHHSEGMPINAQYYGIADVDVSPAKVVQLNDGEYGLMVDTKLLKYDPATPKIIEDFQNGNLNSFSITYDTNMFMTTDFDFIDNRLVRVLNPDTKLMGYTAASNPVNPNAVATEFGFKEFKELTRTEQTNNIMTQTQTSVDAPETKEVKVEAPVVKPEEMKEFLAYKDEKKKLEEKEIIENAVNKVVDNIISKIEVKEKVLKTMDTPTVAKTIPTEIKEFNEIFSGKKVEIKEQFSRAARVCDSLGIDWQKAYTTPIERREFKHFGTNGSKLEYKGLGITTNQNTDTDYLQSSAELQDIYDPVIYNALNQATNTWNILAKDDYSSKGNNQVQFSFKTAANTTAAYYVGNAVATGNETRLKFQTKFKKIQVGVAVDGDMIAAARGGPVNDVFAQEILDATLALMSVVNASLYDEVGLETAAAVIGFEYITDSAGNTSLYNLTRSTTNKLAPASAGNTYINQASSTVSMTNLRAAIRQARNEGANKSNLVFFTNPVQGDMLRGKFDDTRRALTSKDTRFGFETDLFIDGVPVYEDTDCNTDDFFLVDLETHRIAIWLPPTVEKLAKTSDSESAFIKMYLATFNRAPRRMVQIYGCATA